nr:MAG TPA: hypothetical protein [Caudoviricetes sp.]
MCNFFNICTFNASVFSSNYNIKHQRRPPMKY